MHHSLVAATIAFVTGITLDGLITWHCVRTWWSLAFVALAATVTHVLRLHVATTRLLLVAALLAGLLRSQLSDPLLEPRHWIMAARQPMEPVRVQVVDDPWVSGTHVVCTAQLKSDAAGTVYTGLVRLTLRQPGSYKPAYGDVLLCRALPEPLIEVPEWQAGTRLRTLKQQGILGQMSLPADQYELLERDAGNPLLTLAYALRHRFSELATTTHEAHTAAFLRAAILGDTASLRPGAVESFRATGTVHILSVSGQQVALLAVVAYFCLSLLPIGRKLPAVLTIAILALYSLMAGSRPSVLRAAIMAAAVLISQMTDRKASPFNGVAMAALAILLYNPADLFTAGFQLSFAATVALVVLTPWLMQYLEGFSPYGSGLLASSLAAYLGTVPLMASHFGTLSIVAPLANLFVLPLVAIIMPTALIALAVAVVSTPFAYIFAAANYGFVEVLTTGVGLLARFPYAEVTVPAPWPSLVFAWYSGLLLLADYHNIVRLIARRQPAAERAPANADWSWILANRPMDPLMSRLESLLEGTASLGPSEEAIAGARGHLGQELADRIDPITLRYLAFAAQQLQEQPGPADRAGTIATIAYLMAMERELDSRVFRYLKVPDEVARSEVARTYRRGHIDKPPRPERDVLALPLQSELLWYYLLPTDGTHRTLVESLSKQLGEKLARPALYLEPSRLALALDRMLKKYYLPIAAGETIDRSRVQQAARDILGDPNFAILREIVAAGSLAPKPPEEKP